MAVSAKTSNCKNQGSVLQAAHTARREGGGGLPCRRLSTPRRDASRWNGISVRKNMPARERGAFARSWRKTNKLRWTFTVERKLLLQFLIGEAPSLHITTAAHHRWQHARHDFRNSQRRSPRRQSSRSRRTAKSKAHNVYDMKRLESETSTKRASMTQTDCCNIITHICGTPIPASRVACAS